MGKCLSWCNTYECVSASLQQYSQTFARTCFQKNSSPSRYRYPLPFRGEKFHLSFPRFRENLLLKIFFLQRKSASNLCAHIQRKGIHHFDERNIFLGPQGPKITILVLVEIELVPCFSLLPSPPWDVSLMKNPRVYSQSEDTSSSDFIRLRLTKKVYCDNRPILES